MSVEFDLAQAILDTMKGCVGDCSMYNRFVVTAGDPVIDCSLLGVGIQNFSPLAQVANCAIYGLNANLVISQCCVPVGSTDGSPPDADLLSATTECLTNDVERVICCMMGASFEIPGAVKQCRPSIVSVIYDRPQGGCVTAKINATFPEVPCCV